MNHTKTELAYMSDLEAHIARTDAILEDIASALKWVIENEEDHWDRLEFLKAWQDGSLATSDDWADYRSWRAARSEL